MNRSAPRLPQSFNVSQAFVRFAALAAAVLLAGCATELDRAPVSNPMPRLADGVYEQSAVDTPPSPQFRSRRIVRPADPGRNLADVRGEALLVFTVQTDGTVSDVTVLRATSGEVARAAVGIAQRYEYTPATLGGVPVACRMKMPVRLNLPRPGGVPRDGVSTGGVDVPPPPEP